jgi:hypothetical protein
MTNKGNAFENPSDTGVGSKNKRNENYEVIEATSDSVPNPIIVGRMHALPLSPEPRVIAENNRQSWWP